MLRYDYWIELKYRISGLRLLAYMSAEGVRSKELILEGWFREDDGNKDRLYAEIKRITTDGIRSGSDPDEVLDSMIRVIPAEEAYKPDLAGCIFRPIYPDKHFERVYNRELHKFRFKKVYEGLIPGNEYIGQSFADLAFGYEPSEAIRNLEEAVDAGSMMTWGKILSQISDREVSILSTGMSRTGRFLLLGGLSDDRVHDVVTAAILFGRGSHKDADRIAERVSHTLAGGVSEHVRK